MDLGQSTTSFVGSSCHPFDYSEVVVVPKKRGPGPFCSPADSSNRLREGKQGCRCLPKEDPNELGKMHPHSEGGSGNQHAALSPFESSLDDPALFGRESGMIGDRFPA